MAVYDAHMNMDDQRNHHHQREKRSWKAFLNRIWGLLDRILQIDEENKMSSRLFRSSQAVQDEKIRQKQQNRFIIHPLSLFRWYWDLVMVLTLTLTLILLPVEIAFYAPEEGNINNDWMIINILVDIIFLVDIILNFRTAYVQGGLDELSLNDGSCTLILVEITSPKVAYHYLTTWFLLDLLSSIPLDYLYQGFSTLAEETSSESIYLTLRILKLTKLMSLLRILRVARLMRYVHKLEELLDVDSKVISMINLVMMMMAFCHWNGCLQYLVSYLEGFPEDSWVRRDGLVDSFNGTIYTNSSTIWKRYTRSIWRAMSHMLSIGYGLYPPQTTSDTWAVMCSMTLGATFYALFIAHMSMLIMTLDFSGRKFDEMISEVKQYMKFRRVPVTVQQRILEYYDHKFQRKYFDESNILKNGPALLSHPLKKEILLHNCRALVSKVPFLGNAPMDFLYQVMCKLEFQVFFPTDVIVAAGKVGEAMYFIEHGVVEIQTPNGSVINSLSDGAYFGEIALLLDERRTASVVAVEICDVYSLRKVDFNEVLAEYPEMKHSLEVIAQQRLNQLDSEQELARSSARMVHLLDEQNGLECVS